MIPRKEGYIANPSEVQRSTSMDGWLPCMHTTDPRVVWPLRVYGRASFAFEVPCAAVRMHVAA